MPANALLDIEHKVLVAAPATFATYELARTKWYAEFHVTAVGVADASLIFAGPVVANVVAVRVLPLLNIAPGVSVATRYARAED